MVKKEAEGGGAVARKAYRAAREESDHDAESDAGDKVSAALINRVRIVSFWFAFSVYSVIPFF